MDNDELHSSVAKNPSKNIQQQFLQTPQPPPEENALTTPYFPHHITQHDVSIHSELGRGRFSIVYSCSINNPLSTNSINTYNETINIQQNSTSVTEKFIDYSLASDEFESTNPESTDNSARNVNTNDIDISFIAPTPQSPLGSRFYSNLSRQSFLSLAQPTSTTTPAQFALKMIMKHSFENVLGECDINIMLNQYQMASTRAIFSQVEALTVQLADCLINSLNVSTNNSSETTISQNSGSIPNNTFNYLNKFIQFLCAHFPFHPSIISALSSFQTQNHVYILLPICPHGTLHDIIGYHYHPTPIWGKLPSQPAVQIAPSSILYTPSRNSPASSVTTTLQLPKSHSSQHENDTHLSSTLSSTSVICRFPQTTTKPLLSQIIASPPIYYSTNASIRSASHIIAPDGQSEIETNIDVFPPPIVSHFPTHGEKCVPIPFVFGGNVPRSSAETATAASATPAAATHNNISHELSGNGPPQQSSLSPHRPKQHMVTTYSFEQEAKAYPHNQHENIIRPETQNGIQQLAVEMYSETSTPVSPHRLIRPSKHLTSLTPSHAVYRRHPLPFSQFRNSSRNSSSQISLESPAPVPLEYYSPFRNRRPSHHLYQPLSIPDTTNIDPFTEIHEISQNNHPAILQQTAPHLNDIPCENNITDINKDNDGDLRTSSNTIFSTSSLVSSSQVLSTQNPFEPLILDENELQAQYNNQYHSICINNSQSGGNQFGWDGNTITNRHISSTFGNFFGIDNNIQAQRGDDDTNDLSFDNFSKISSQGSSSSHHQQYTDIDRIPNDTNDVDIKDMTLLDSNGGVGCLPFESLIYDKDVSNMHYSSTSSIGQTIEPSASFFTHLYPFDDDTKQPTSQQLQQLPPSQQLLPPFQLQQQQHQNNMNCIPFHSHQMHSLHGFPTDLSAIGDNNNDSRSISSEYTNPIDLLHHEETQTINSSATINNHATPPQSPIQINHKLTFSPNSKKSKHHHVHEIVQLPNIVGSVAHIASHPIRSPAPIIKSNFPLHQTPFAINSFQNNEQIITTTNYNTTSHHLSPCQFFTTSLPPTAPPSLASASHHLTSPSTIFSRHLPNALPGGAACYQRSPKALPIPQIVHYFVAMCCSTIYLHVLGIVHRDIKSENMLIDIFPLSDDINHLVQQNDVTDDCTVGSTYNNSLSPFDWIESPIMAEQQDARHLIVGSNFSSRPVSGQSFVSSTYPTSKPALSSSHHKTQQQQHVLSTLKLCDFGTSVAIAKPCVLTLPRELFTIDNNNNNNNNDDGDDKNNNNNISSNLTSFIDQYCSQMPHQIGKPINPATNITIQFDVAGTIENMSPEIVANLLQRFDPDDDNDNDDDSTTNLTVAESHHDDSPNDDSQSQYHKHNKSRGTSHGFATDYWSLGCVLFEMITGYPAFSPTDVPFGQYQLHSQQYATCNESSSPSFPNPSSSPSPSSPSSLSRHIHNSAGPFNLPFDPNDSELSPIDNMLIYILYGCPCYPINQTCDALAIDLIYKLLHVNPNARWTALDALLHPFIQQNMLPHTRLLMWFNLLLIRMNSLNIQNTTLTDGK